MMWLRARGGRPLALALLAACPSPSPEPEATGWEATTTSTFPGTTGAIDALRLDALRVDVTPDEDGGAHLEVVVEATQTRTRVVDGLASAGGEIRVVPRWVALDAGGVAVGPAVPADHPGWMAPEGSPYTAIWTMPFDLPPGLSRDDLSLTVEMLGQQLVVPLAGEHVVAQGVSGVPVVALDDDGRPYAGTVRGERDGLIVEEPPGRARLLLPLDAATWSLVAGDGRQAQVRVPPEGPATVSGRLSPSSDAVALRSLFASDLAGQGLLGRPPSVQDVLVRGDEPEALADWVSEHVAVVRAQGIRRSEDAVVRSGRGTPIERAGVVFSQLQARGIDARIACADPPPELAQALYPVEDAVLDDPAVVALATALTSSPAPGLDPAGVASGLVPEWCWVEYEAVPDEPWVPLWLAPEGLRDAVAGLEETRWRVFNRLPTEVWRMRVKVSAWHRRARTYEETVLLDRWVSPLELEQVALLVDLVPEGRDLRARDGLLHPEEVGMRVGPLVPREGLSSIQVEVYQRDPVGVAPERVVRTVWQAGGDRPGLERWRMVVSGGLHDTADGRVLAMRRDALRPGRHAAPAAQALALEAWHVLDALGTAERAHGPTLVLSRIEKGQDGQVRRFLDLLEAPTDVGGAGAQAELSARDAVVRARALGVDPPAAPERWLSDAGALGALPGMDDRVHITLVRQLEQGPVGVGRDGSFWVQDAVGGGWRWIDPEGVPVDARPPAEGAEDVLDGEGAWLPTVWCAVLAGWPALGVDRCPW